MEIKTNKMKNRDFSVYAIQQGHQPPSFVFQPRLKRQAEQESLTKKKVKREAFRYALNEGCWQGNAIDCELKAEYPM